MSPWSEPLSSMGASDRRPLSRWRHSRPGSFHSKRDPAHNEHALYLSLLGEICSGSARWRALEAGEESGGGLPSWWHTVILLKACNG